MKAVMFFLGLLVGAAGIIGAVIYFKVGERREDDIVFAAKAFFDIPFGPDDALVEVSGTLTGPDMGYPNNSYAIRCYQDLKECFVSYVQQIGAGQIGRMDGPGRYPIAKWNASQIVAQDAPSTIACSRTTFTIDRQSKNALWVEEPINQTSTYCDRSPTTIRKFTIENSPGWKRIFGKREQ